MYHVYILKSQKDGRTYVGYTQDLQERFYRHNAGLAIATKHRRPFTLLMAEEYEKIDEAKKRERYWKSGAGRRKMKELFR